ncbi:MAG: YkgJ family cysteine cluster protein [Tuberibacillus sp.]
MESLPCQGCRGLCCGPVPVTESELKKIKKKVKSMPTKLRDDLKNQQRFFGTCIFYDDKNDRCGIHSARPSICKAFGYHKNLTCFRKPEAATEKDYVAEDNPVGILSVDFTWKDFI